MSPRTMPRTYAMARLLEHGALTAVQLREITGWDAHTVGNVLHTLLGDGTVAATRLQGHRHYLLTVDLAGLDRRPVGRPKGSTANADPNRNPHTPNLRAAAGAQAHNPFNLSNLS